MIKSIRFKNFFSFRDCKVELNNLNALIGINGSGKSNFIKAIKLLKATVTEGALPDLILNQWGGFDAVYFAGNDAEANKKIELEFEFEDAKSYNAKSLKYIIAFKKVGSSQNYSLTEFFYLKTLTLQKINNEEEWTENWTERYLEVDVGKAIALTNTPPKRRIVSSRVNDIESFLVQSIDKTILLFPITVFRKEINRIAVYSGFDTAPSCAIRKPMLPTGISVRLSSNGGNLTSILNRIKINSKSYYNKIVDSLRAINPQYNGIDFNLIGINIELMLEEKGFERSIHVTHISDGTLRFLCLLAIIHNPERGKLVCIDEPENGLHPDMIREFVDSMNNVSKDTQFIISTHSDHILNNLFVENVLVCEKDDNNATTINTFRDKDFVEWAAQYSTGKLWRDGDLGGNRY